MSLDASAREVMIDTASGVRRASLALVILEDQQVHPGDWVTAHTGLVTRRLDAATARELMQQQAAIRAQQLEEQP